MKRHVGVLFAAAVGAAMLGTGAAAHAGYGHHHPMPSAPSAPMTADSADSAANTDGVDSSAEFDGRAGNKAAPLAPENRRWQTNQAVWMRYNYGNMENCHKSSDKVKNCPSGAYQLGKQQYVWAHCKSGSWAYVSPIESVNTPTGTELRIRAITGYVPTNTISGLTGVPNCSLS